MSCSTFEQHAFGWKGMSLVWFKWIYRSQGQGIILASLWKIDIVCWLQLCDEFHIATQFHNAHIPIKDTRAMVIFKVRKV